MLRAAPGCLAVSDMASALASYSSPAMIFRIEYKAQHENKGALLHAHHPGQTWPTLEHVPQSLLSASSATLHTEYNRL